MERASFAREAPFTPVDLSWYSGIHPYGYSLLAPWIMAMVGVALSGLTAAVAGAVLLARLLRESERPMLASVVGSVFLVANVASGRTTFALGAVAALAALVMLPRLRWVAPLAVLTALLSPVAAAFLGFVAALLLLHRRPGGWTLGLSASLPVVGLAVLFPGGGIQPFDAQAAAPAVAVGFGLTLLTASPIVRTGGVLYAAAVLVFVNHDDPFGSNVIRLAILLGATMVLATSRRNGVLIAVAVTGCLVWQVDPTHADLQALGGPRTDRLTAELVQLGSRRAEVAAPLNHRESWQVAERVPLARGWSRQIDLKRNPLFYKEKLSASDYRQWLDDNAVDTVATPRGGLVDFGSTTEVELLRSPVPGLLKVWQDADWTVFRVTDPQPIAVGVVSSGRTALVLRAAAPSSTEVLVRWSRWLSLEGAGCIQKHGDHVRLTFRRAGTVTLTSSLRPKGHC